MKLRHLFVSLLAIAGLFAGCDDSSDKNSVPEPETTEELCSDGVDNDLNGLIDCKEESCKAFEHCKDEGAEHKEICDNTTDDDGDGKTDCDDEDCRSAKNCKTGEQKTEICDNTTDDDGDGNADCDDEDCQSAQNCKTGEQKTEICDNTTDDDGDGNADCDDEDCQSAQNCKTGEQKTEICDNTTDDDGDGKADCDDEDCASAENCQQTKEICDNEKDDDDNGKIDCDDEVCASAAECAPKTLKNLQYKVGLVSDIHFDTDNRYEDEHKDDLLNAISYFRKNDVDFIANCGDIAEYEPEDYKAFHTVYQDNAYGPTGGKLRLMTAIGNHDYLQLFTIQTEGKNLLEWVRDTKFNFDFFTGEVNNDMKFFEYNGVWDKQKLESSERTVISKLSYYWPRDNNIFVFLSLDYGLEPNKADARASNLLDMNNKYVKEMEAYVADTAYDKDKEKNYNYQFYHPNTLTWLKDIIENNPDKHIFVFTHHFITHKAGNGVPYNGKPYYSSRRVWPYSSDPAVLIKNYSGANSLSGLEFHFINKLNNTHKNVIWFSGHSHFQWEDAQYDDCLAFCNKEFDFVQPTGEETVPVVDDINTSPDLKLYTRVNDKPKGLSAYNVHIPSLAKPKDMGTHNELYKASQGGLMEVYENGVRINGISFKKEDTDNYENKVVVTREIFFP